jgi:hypothetical protein
MAMAFAVRTLPACALLLSIAGANAATLTPEQQALVQKYNISAADQEKLFPKAALPAQSAKAEAAYPAAAANANPEDDRFGNVFDNTYVWTGLDTYKSIGDRLTNINGGTGSLTGSFGAVAGVNTSVGIGDFPIRFQAGASYGVYDFEGRIRLVPNDTDVENQLFVTAGFYKRGDMLNAKDPLSYGLVYDLFHAEQWGINANNIDLSQIRGIVGFALNESNEIGAWGTVSVNNDQAAVTVAGAPGVLRTIRASNQANFYLKHNFDFGAQITGYAGWLDNADIGSWQFGLTGKAPLSPNWSLYGNANYAFPSASPGPNGSGEEQFNASVGLAYYFGGKAQSPTVTGRKGLPLLDVANNGSFLVTD